MSVVSVFTGSEPMSYKYFHSLLKSDQQVLKAVSGVLLVVREATSCNVAPEDLPRRLHSALEKSEKELRGLEMFRDCSDDGKCPACSCLLST
jgi:hypothetical protein